MPTINKPFLLKLLLAVLGLAGLLTGAHTLQARRIPDALRRQAERAADAGKGDAAIHYLRQYLEFEPDDIDALDKLADLLKLRDPSYRGYTELVFLYDKILRLDPERHAVRRDILAACLKMGRYSDAVAHAEALLAKFPAEPQLWQQLGAAQTGLNRLTEARRAYETAIARAPGEPLGYQRLAQLLWKNAGKPAEARTVLDRMIAALPQEPQAYYARARFESFLAEEVSHRGQAVNPDAALSDLRRVLELDPENADASLLLAEILQKGRDVPAAHAILRDAVGLYPRDLRFVRSLAWLELVRGNVPASMAVLEDGLRHSPDGFDLLVPLADLLVQQGDTTRSAEIMRRLEARRAPAVQVNYLKARVAMRDRKWAEAVNTLETLRGDTLKLPGLETQLNLLLAVCFEKTGDTDAQEKALKRVTGTDPGNVTARVGLATVYLNQGRFDDAAREYETAARSPYAPPSVHAQLIRLKMRRLASPRNGGPADEWTRLEQAVSAAVAKFGPMSSDVAALRAEVAAAQGKHDEAIKLLRQETTRRPGDTRLWAGLAEMSANAAGTAAGLAVMDEAQATAGDGPDIRLARARLYAREPGRVRPIDPLAERIDTWAEADQLRLLYGLVEVYDQAGDRAKVVHTLRRIAAHRPSDAALWMRLHERAAEENDAAVTGEARAALAKIEGDGGPSVLVCDATAGKDSRNADRLLAAFGPSPTRADACLALAKLKADAGETPEALRLTERAFTLEPTRYESARAYAALLCRTGADDRAAQILTRLAVDPRWAGEPFRRMVRGVLAQLPPEAAEKVLAWCRPLVAHQPGGLGWLGQCYTAIGNAEAAGAHFALATQGVSTATADDWLRLTLFHADAGRRDAATETLDKARQHLPSGAFFAVAAVFCETPNGKEWAPQLAAPSERRVFVQSRLAMKLSRSAQDEAAKLLEDYLAGSDLRQADTGWARRNLAMLYAIRGTTEDRQKAMDLLQKDEGDGAGPDDLRATAGVLTNLARYLEGDDRKAVLARAAAALESVYKTSRSPRDLYHLSQLHRVSGNRKASRDCLNTLLRSDPLNLYYLTTALEELTEGREFKTAGAFADRLRSKYQGEFRAVAAVARYECRSGRPGRALALAEGYAGAADSGAGDYLARAARVAELLDELTRYPEVRGTESRRKMVEAAVERYAALAPARPEAVVAVAGVLAADGRVADAFTKIEQFNQYLSVRVRALAGLAALRSGGATDRQFGAVEGWLRAALAEEPDSTPLRLSEAEFLALRQDYAKSAAAYTKLLDRDPRNVVALNNLAWILAADPGTAGRAAELLDRATREAGLTGELLDTRARLRITLKQLTQAGHDLTAAMTQEATPLRHFHMAVLRMAQTPPQKDEAVKAFREAKARGLDPKTIHPADLPVYKQLEAEGGRTTH